MAKPAFLYEKYGKECFFVSEKKVMIIGSSASALDIKEVLKILSEDERLKKYVEELDPKQLVNELAAFGEIKESIGKIEEKLKNSIMEMAIPIIENTGAKSACFYGDKCFVQVTAAESLNLVEEKSSYETVETIFKTLTSNYINKEDKVKYSLLAAFKNIAIPIYKKDYIESDLKDVLNLPEEKMIVANKKLKGKFDKDKQILISLGISEEDVDEIATKVLQFFNWKKITKAFEQAGIEGKRNIKKALESIKKAVEISETHKLTVKSE